MLFFRNVGLLENGRYACQFAGCKKSFAFNGKHRIAHEATHGLHQSIAPIKGTTIPPTRDVRNYQLAILEYGLLYLNFCDAISEGDGMRIIQCWKFFLMFLKVDGPSSRKYSLEALHLLSQIYAILPPRDAHRLVWNRFVKAKYGMGGNIPLDLALEHYNRLLKKIVKKMGANASNHKAVNRFCKCITVTKQVIDNFHHECNVLRQSGKHVQKKYSSDLNKIVAELLENNAFKFTKDRSYKHFKNCSSSLLEKFDLHSMFKWLNVHKKSVYQNKTAR